MFRISVLCTVLLNILNLTNVNSMSLEGPALTRYDPCGLGVIHFDRITGRFWRGEVHFRLYSNLVQVATEIYFEGPVIIYRLPENTTFYASRRTLNELLVAHKAPVPSEYVFNLEVIGNETDVPVVSIFIMNNVILCNDKIKESQTLTSFDGNRYVTNIVGDSDAHVCGRRSMRHTELVSVRTEAEAGDWPWHVALLVRKAGSKGFIYNCGGNIISRTTVLTAGHCIFKDGKLLDANKLLVVAGTNNYKTVFQIGIQRLIAQRLILHPGYHDEYATSDLGIVKVNRFIYTEFVQPICLWGPKYDKTSLVGKEAVIVGFGSTENDTQSDVLRSSFTVVQNDSTCTDFKQDVYEKLINEFTICAGYGPTYSINPRNGDSGGGLAVSTLQPDHMISWYLRGVLSKCGVSPGHTLCDPTYYVVYTDVGPHYGWIYHHSDLQFRINVF